MIKSHYHTILIASFCLGLGQQTSAFAQMEVPNPIDRAQNQNDRRNPISDLERNTDDVTVSNPSAMNSQTNNNNDDDPNNENSRETPPFGETPLVRPVRPPSQFDTPEAQEPLEDFSTNTPNANNTQNGAQNQLTSDTIQADEGIDLERNQDQDQDLAITPEMRDSDLDMRDNIPVDTNTPTPNGAGRSIQPLENGTVTRQRIDGRGVAPRTAMSREEVQPFDPLGIPLGSFYLFPSLDVSEFFTDNVFISATRKSSDAVTRIAPGLRLESNWNNHALEFTLDGVSSHHAKFKTQDTKSLNAGLRGRIDVTARTNVLGGASYAISQETGSSIDFNAAAAAPSDIETTTTFAELNHRFNRLSVRLRGTREEMDFANGSGAGGLIINNAGRNRTADSLQSQLNYEFSPLLSVFLDNNFEWTNYVNPAAGNEVNRDNTKRLNAIGARAEITPFLNGQFRVGNQLIDPKDSRLAKTNAIVIDASLIWTPTELTTISGNYATTFAETTQVGSSATQSNQYALTIQHQALENFIINGGFSLDTQTGLGDNNEIKTYLASLGSEYRLNRNIYLTSLLSYTDYNSSTLNSDYEIKSATIGLRLQH